MTNINCSGTPGGSGIGDDTGSNNTYDGNVVHHIGDYPTKCDYVHAIYVDDSGDVVSNNISYNNVGNGLYTNHGTSGGVTFVNNLSFANLEYGVGVNGSLSGSVVANNILVGNGLAAVKTWSSTSNTQITNNIMFGNASTVMKDGSATEQGTISSDPQLVSYQAQPSGTVDYNNYRPKAGSPAIDKGTTTNAPKIDFDGNTRPQGSGVDIGPFEYGSTGGTPQPSQGQNTTPTIVPTFVCAGSQNGICPTTSPTTNPSGGAQPTSSPTSAESLTPTSSTSIAPSISQPVDTGTPSQNKSKHSKHSKGNGNLFASLLSLLLSLISLILKYLGKS
jgi:hypothetical protein